MTAPLSRFRIQRFSKLADYMVSFIASLAPSACDPNVWVGPFDGANIVGDCCGRAHHGIIVVLPKQG
jgi:hypothetical protein